MQLANLEAKRFNHEYIGTEHVLLGLVAEGSGVAANVLKNLDVDLPKVRLEVEKLVPSGPDMVSEGKLPQTTLAKKVIEYSMEEARKLNHNYVGTEHLLLGLLREQEGVAAQVLMNLGLKLEEVRQVVHDLLGTDSECDRAVVSQPTQGDLHRRFTDRARKVMQLANQEAQRFNHEYVGTEHQLLGLIKEGSGVAANVLKNLGMDLRKIRLEVEKLVQSGPDMVIMGQLPQTPRAKNVLVYAMEEARNLNHNYVGTEHILLGLLREQEGVAAQVLMNLGLRLEEVRAEVLNLLDHGTDWDHVRKELLDDLGHGSAPAKLTDEEIAKLETYLAGRVGRSDSGSQDLPGSIYNRSTDRARRVVQLANQQAKQIYHEYIGTEHVLLGLVSKGSGVAANVLKNFNIDLEKVRSEVDKLVQGNPARVTGNKLPWTARAKKVLEYAMEEAHNLNHNYVGTEHILLGLLREQEGVAAQVLMNLGLKLEEVRKEVLNLLGHGFDAGEAQ